MQLFIAAASIFFLRLTDVTVGTIRSLYAVRGRRFAAAALGLAESSIFILAISRVMKDVDNPVKMLGYALGFSAGVFMGITIERWIASGTILARVVTREHSPHLIDGLRQNAFGVTELAGTGRAGDVRRRCPPQARHRTPHPDRTTPPRRGWRCPTPASTG